VAADEGLNAVLTTLGLVVDIIAALLLVVRLFRHPKPLCPGWHYSPPDAAAE
jgi:hypothetical protein